MNRQDVLQLYPQLRLFLRYLKITNLFSITLVIILYLVSGYCLLKGQMVLAIILATLAVVFFHLAQKTILSGLKYWLYRDKVNRKMLDFLDSEMEARSAKLVGSKKGEEIKEFLLLLDKVMGIVDKK